MISSFFFWETFKWGMWFRSHTTTKKKDIRILPLKEDVCPTNHESPGDIFMYAHDVQKDTAAHCFPLCVFEHYLFTHVSICIFNSWIYCFFWIKISLQFDWLSFILLSCRWQHLQMLAAGRTSLYYTLIVFIFALW